MIPRIISVRQPWAWAITVPPAKVRKTIENRNWSTNYRGPILIHAGLQPRRQPEIREFIEFLVEKPIPDPLPLGGIVGWANLVEVITKSKDPWFQGKFGFVLEGAKPVPFVPCKGRLGIYYPDADLIKELRKKRIIS